MLAFSFSSALGCDKCRQSPGAKDTQAQPGEHGPSSSAADLRSGRHDFLGRNMGHPISNQHQCQGHRCRRSSEHLHRFPSFPMVVETLYPVWLSKVPKGIPEMGKIPLQNSPELPFPGDFPKGNLRSCVGLTASFPNQLSVYSLKSLVYPRERSICALKCLSGNKMIHRRKSGGSFIEKYDYFVEATLWRTRALRSLAWASWTSVSEFSFRARMASARSWESLTRRVSMFSAHSKVVATKVTS